MKIKLKKCPFCGGTAEFKAQYDSYNCRYAVFVQCGFCDAQSRECYTAPFDTLTDEIYAESAYFWQTRAKRRKKV